MERAAKQQGSLRNLSFAVGDPICEAVQKIG
jgi:hypothetical protein